MKHYLAISLLLFVGLASVLGLSQEGKDTALWFLTITSWNLRGYPEQSPSLRHWFSQSLESLYTDILCVQEIGNQKNISEFLATEQGFDKVAFKNSSNDQDNAIFFAPTVQMIELPDLGGFVYPAQAAYFKYRGLDAVIINIHLAHTWEKRIKERDLLVSIGRQALQVDPDVIIAGDFNTTGKPGDTIWGLASALGFKVAIPRNSSIGTLYNSGKTYDYILISPDLYLEEAGPCCIIPTFDDEARAQAVSDHRPVSMCYWASSSFSDCEIWPPPQVARFAWDLSSRPSPVPERPLVAFEYVEAWYGKVIVLVNNSDAPVDLGGWQLSNGRSSYTFPSDTILESKADYVITARTYASPYNTQRLVLNNWEDQIYLIDPAGKVRDTLAWKWYTSND